MLISFFDSKSLLGKWNFDVASCRYTNNEFKDVTLACEWIAPDGESTYISFSDDSGNTFVVACVTSMKQGSNVVLHMTTVITPKDGNVRFASFQRGNVGDMSKFYLTVKGKSFAVPKELAPKFHDTCQLTGLSQRSVPFNFVIEKDTGKISIQPNDRNRGFEFLSNKLLCRIGEIGPPPDDTPIQELDFCVQQLRDIMGKYCSKDLDGAEIDEDPFRLLKYLLTSTKSINPFSNNEREIGKPIASPDMSMFDIRDFLSSCFYDEEDGCYKCLKLHSTEVDVNDDGFIIIRTVGDLRKAIAPF